MFNKDIKLIWENYQASNLAEIENKIRRIRDFSPVVDISDTDSSVLQKRYFDLVIHTITNLDKETKKAFITRLIDQKLLPEEFWDYYIDNNLFS